MSVVFVLVSIFWAQCGCKVTKNHGNGQNISVHSLSVLEFIRTFAPSRLKNRIAPTMDKEQAISLVRQYKQVIAPHFDGKAKVYMFGSYSKGYARPESDIDVAVIVPSLGDNWWSWTKSLWHEVRKVSTLIEPVLMEENSHSPLYDDVMRTGVAV